MKRKDRLPLVTACIVGVIMLACGLVGQVWGGTYQYKFREYFDGNTADSVSWTLWTGADSTGTWDTTNATSVIDSVEVDDTKASSLKFRFFFFGLVSPYIGSWTYSIPPTQSSGSGSGAYTVNIKFLDTSAAPDAFVPAVSATLRGWNTSVPLGVTATDGSGVATFGTSATNIAFKGVGPSAQYVWPINWEDSVATSGDHTDTVKGYFIDVSVASGSQVCAVTVIVLDNGGRPARNVQVSAYLARTNLRDSAGYAVANFTQTQKTDSNGRATFQCRWSSYLIPATKWQFTVGSPSNSRKSVTVPRQASYTLQF